MQDLNVSIQQVNLTITSYLVIQGIAPLIWGPLSDTIGRRPVYLASFTIYVIANIALSFTPNYAVLVAFRAMQAAGAASTASIGNGVLQDICPISERGGYISFYQAVRNFAVAFGPVLGGILAQSLGFRAIFVFLLCLSGAIVVLLAFFLPETMRSLAGNGSWRLKGPIYQSLWRMIRPPKYVRDPDSKPSRKKVTLGTFAGPFKLLVRKEVALNVYFFGLIYAVWSMVTSSTTSLFATDFGLNELQLGLIYLPNGRHPYSLTVPRQQLTEIPGFGTIVGSAIIGKVLNRDFAAASQAYKMAHDLPDSHELSPKNVPPDFPVERLRLRRLPWALALFVFTLAGYGFSMSFPSVYQRPGWIALPLVLQFLIAMSANAMFSINQTLVADLCPGKGASSTGINNLVRCSLAAIMVAFVDEMIKTLGVGATYLGLAFLVIGASPLFISNWLWGMEWRLSQAKQEKGEKEWN